MSNNSDNYYASLMEEASRKIAKLQSELDELKYAHSEPIAIIGMGCRFPGANNPEEFWQLLRDGVDAISEVPKNRWNIEAYYDPNPEAPGKMYTRFGGFVDRFDEFDPQFFGISHREALSLDPQQRLLLEVSWEALENSALMPERLTRKTGVFIGVDSNDYHQILFNQDPAAIDSYVDSGNSAATASGRLSYLLGLTGPCFSVNTACSSSLVTVHLACQSLRRGECDLALTGGVTLILSPEHTICLSKARMLSPDGRCKTFDATANGFVRGEGCGVIVLKRLRDAQADGDNILAVIRGCAINQDGRTSALTVPNGKSQQALIHQALADGGVQPDQVSYIEAHGTGTSLGDPIEVGALGAVFGQRKHPLAIGSVKTNIGHLEAAAGIAGLIKVVLSMQHGEIPPSLHYEQPNPHINWQLLPVKVSTQRMPWPIGSRLAGVSSFGFSGTNAHVVLEEAPPELREKATVERPLHLLCLSAKSPEALNELAARYSQHLATNPTLELGDICFTANTGRSHFNYRLSVVASQPKEAREKLAAFSAGLETIGVFQGRVNTNNKIAFLFTGQGSQYVGMGRQLYQQAPTFRASLDRCGEILRPLLEKPLLEVLYPEEGDNLPDIIDETAYTQPALFALEYALFQLWKSWGLEPDVVMGHSVGEYVAACVAGVFSLEDGLKLIAERGRLTQALPSGGEMVSVMASEQQIASVIQPYAQKVSIAALNGSESLVISGLSKAINSVCATLEASGIKTKKLNVSHAFHSHLMEPMLAEFEQVLRQVTFSEPQIKLLSNITGDVVTSEVTKREYWCRHILQPVRFAASMKSIEQLGVEVLVECGPKPILLGMGRLCLPEHQGLWLASLRPQQDDWQQLLTSLGELYVRGVPLNWVGFDRDYSRRRLQLPTYPFQRQRYWIEATDKGNGFKAFQNNGVRSNSLHPLLGQQLYMAGTAEIRFESQISQNSPAWVKDHRVFETPILPGTGYIEMALAAGAVIAKSDNLWLEDVVIQKAMTLLENEVKTVQVILTPEESGIYSFKIYSLDSSSAEENNPQSSWTLHASGKLLVKEKEPIAAVDLAPIRAQCTQEISVEELYRRVKEQGIEYGSSFQGLEQVWRDEQGNLGKIDLPQELVSELGNYQLHPVLLDTCLQVLEVIPTGESQQNTYVPVGLERLQVWDRLGTSVWCHAQWRKVESSGQQSLSADFRVFSDSGKLIAALDGLQLMHARREAMLGIPQQTWKNWLYEVEWRPDVGYGLPPDYLPSPQEVRSRLQSQLVELMTHPSLPVYGFALTQIETLSIAYVVAALRQMGWEFQVGERFSTAQIAQQLGVVSQHQQLLGRLLQLLVEVGILQRIDNLWEVVSPPEIQNPQQALTELSYPEAEAEITLLGRCGPKLASVLRGECDPLRLLFPEGDTTTLTQLYQDGPMVRVTNTLVQQTVLSALERLPQRRGWRILEIGAGTGATTSYILPHLQPDRTEYVFTDIGAFFTAKAQEKFKDYPFVRYQVLDIELDPIEQGFEPNHYDLIVAANVLHATSDLRETVQHVKQLLAPSGMLVLVEDTASARWVDLTFGLTEGWWKFSDRELRPDYPLLSAKQWCSLLQELGFKQAVSVSPNDVEVPYKTADLPEMAVIVAPAEVLPEVATPDNWLILADTQGVGQQLAVLLQSVGELCTLVYPGKDYQQIASQEFRIDPANPEHFERLLLAVPQLHSVVHCWSLDAASDPTAADLEVASIKGCGSTLHLVQAIVKKSSQAPRVWLVTRGAQAMEGNNLPGIAQSPLWGMRKAIRLEYPELNCSVIDLDPEATGDEASSLFEEIWSQDAEDQVAFRSQTRYVARLVRHRHSQNGGGQTQLDVPDNQPFRLEISKRGTPDNLQLVQTNRRQPGAGEVEIRVRATGLNFIDVLDALGALPFKRDNELGGECAGEIVAIGEGVEEYRVGDAVMAIAIGSFSKYATTRSQLLVPIPDGLSFEEAAAIPLNFVTAYYALHQIASISAKDKVLIHAAAGGTGMAAVKLVLAAGAEVFATASPGKWEALKSMGVQHIYNSRTLDFAPQVMADTSGRGVDIVLNSLTGEGFIEKSLSVLSPKGRFLEMAKRDVWDSEQVKQFKADILYHFIDVRQICLQQPGLLQPMLRHLSQQFAQGKLSLPPLKIFPIQEVVSAFRYMQRSQHIGKIVVAQPEKIRDLNSHSVSFRGDSSYLITGGMGGLGLAVARWIVERGARNLVLLGRSQPSESVNTQLRELELFGANVVLAQADVSDYEQVNRVLTSVKQSAKPLRGIIHAAGVLDDGILQQLSWQRFGRVMAPKVQGAWNLHILTQNLHLDFFVLFSSTASLLGAAGQANHSAANSFLDALAFYRRSQGLPATSINWGTWGKIGIAARRQLVDRIGKTGEESMGTQQAFQALEQLLWEAPVQVGVSSINWSRYLEGELANWPFLRDLGLEIQCSRHQSTEATSEESKGDSLRDTLVSATAAERQQLLESRITEQVARVLGFAGSKLDIAESVTSLGIDSLMAIELRSRLNNETGVNLPVMKIMQGLSISQLAELILEELALAKIILSAPPSTELTEDMEEIAV